MATHDNEAKSVLEAVIALAHGYGNAEYPRSFFSRFGLAL